MSPLPIQLSTTRYPRSENLQSRAFLSNLIPLPLRRAAIFFGTVTVLAVGSYAETESMKSMTFIDLGPESNPLCFFGGALCFDTQDRLRVEIRDNNYDFDSHAKALNDGAWLLNRFRLGAMWTPSSWVHVYAQGQDSREWFSNRNKTPGLLGAEGDDSFDLRQGYIEIGDSTQFPLVLKAGRQELIFGNERLIGVSDWNNFTRTFDAVKLSWIEPKWRLDLFTSSVVVIKQGDFNQSDLFNGNNNDRQQVFSGAYFTAGDLSFGSLELYALWLSEANGGVSNMESAVPSVRPTVGAASKPSSYGTYGGRVHGDPKKLHGFEFDVEGAFQNGDLQGTDLNAYAVHAGLGYNFDLPCKPRLWFEYNYATGDSDPTDGHTETFQNLFPSNHKFYGYMDLFSWQNLHNPMIGLQLSPMKNVTAELDYHGFWLADTKDTWYRSTGAAVRPVAPAGQHVSSFVGTELDFVLNWKVNKHLTLGAGYCHFFTGDYVSSTGPSDAANLGYLTATISF